MFDDLFKTDTKTDITNRTISSKSTGMFDDLFKKESKQTTTAPQSTTTTPAPVTPSPVSTVIPPGAQFPKPKIKDTFLNVLKSQFFLTGSGGFLSKKTKEAVDTQVVQPVLDKSLNTQLGKDIITTSEKATRGSSIFKAMPKAVVETLSDKIAGVKTDKDIVDYYGEAVSEWEKGGQDPEISFVNKLSRGVLDSGVQSAVGVLLNFVPLVGTGASTAYFGSLSASEQINERGQVNSLGNIAIDVVGDRMLGNTIEGLFKAPVKELIKTGFLETAKRTLASGAKGFAVEGLTEPTQTFLKYANDYNNAKTPEEKARIVEETKEYVKSGGMTLEFLIGGISGAGISTLANVANESMINPNIPKPRLGITEDDDKEYTPEQNKLREAFREDIKQDLVDTGFNKPYVARQVSNETGIDNAITTLMVDEIAETIQGPKVQPINTQQIIQQALNEAGMTQEEAITEEVPTEPAKMKVSEEESLINEARKYKSAEEFVKGQTKISQFTDEGKEGKFWTTPEGADEGYGSIKKDAFVDTSKLYQGSSSLDYLEENGLMTPKIKKQIENAWNSSDPNMEYKIPQDIAEADLKKKGFAGAHWTSEDDLNPTQYQIWDRSVIKTKSQLEEIWNQAQGEDVKLKIKAESTKKLQAKIDDHIARNIDDLLDQANQVDRKGKLRLDEIEDLEGIQEKIVKGSKLSQEDRLLYNETAKKLGREDLLPSQGLDTLTTKEDNKTYDTKKGIFSKEGDNGEVQDNLRGLREGDERSGDTYQLEDRSKDRGISTSTRQNDGRSSIKSASLSGLSTKLEVENKVKQVFPEAKQEVIDTIVASNSILNDIGVELYIQRADTLDNRTDFDAGIQSSGSKSMLTLNNKDVANIKKDSIWHEIFGHKWYQNLTDQQREAHFNKIKELYNSDSSLFDKFLAKQYWEMFIDQAIKADITNANPGISTREMIPMLRELGFINDNNEVIYPENILETVFNFTPISDKLNKYLRENGYNPSTGVLEYNNLMGEEINSYVAENAELFKDSIIPEISKYSNDILNGTLKFKKLEVTITFGGAKFKLKSTTNLTSKDIIRKLPNIELKRDIVITDVYGEKATLKAGEGITPYEVTGNKYILQDGEAYLVSKSQAQNVINNSKTGEAKPFAPELEQTEETILGQKDVAQALNMGEDDVFDSLPKNVKTIIENYSEGGKKYINDSYKNNNAMIDELNKVGYNADYGLDGEIDTLYKISEGKPTKYANYTLPGGENYKEILIKAPANESLSIKGRQAELDTISNDLFGKPYGELNDVSKMDQVSLMAKKQITSDFKSGHWDEPNVISHIRMNERTYNGKKVAFMEELQSDWAREGRDKGFIQPQKQLTQKQIKDKQEQDLNNVGIFIEQDMDGSALLVDKDGEPLEYDELSASKKSLVDTYMGDAETYQEIRGSSSAEAVPYNPLLKNWQELSIKRALQEAVNSNAKYFAWINGPQTAARYNLSKEIDKIRWEIDDSSAVRKAEGGKNVIIYPKTGQEFNILVNRDGIITSSKHEVWKGKPISEVIGKGISESIMKEESGNLSGEGLNVGGEWASNLYDRQVKTIVENLTGQKVEMLDMGLPVEKDGGANWYQNINNRRVDIGLEITNKAFKNDYIGLEIYRNGDSNTYIITDVLGDGKFKAIKTGEYAGIYLRDGESFLKLKKEKPVDYRYIIKEFPPKTFNIKPSTQMAIEITPEVKAIVKGEAPQVKVSGKLPFEEQAMAPAMFKLKLGENIDEYISKEYSPKFLEAIKNTPGAKYTNEGFEIDISRYQKEEQHGMPSVRQGVFYLPEKNSPYKKYYATGKNGYGGGDRIEGRTTFKNPIVVEAGTGGKAVEKAYDVINGKGAYQKMRSDVLDKVISGYGRRVNPEDVAELLTQYNEGSDYSENYDVAYNIVENSKEGNTLAYAIQENIAGQSVKNAGYDSIISYSKSGGVPRLSEVFDVRALEYPEIGQKDFSYEEFYKETGIESNLALEEPAKFKIKLPDVNTGNKAEDAKQILAHVEKKLGVSSMVKSIKEQETLVEISKEVLDQSPLKDLEKYVATGGTYKGQLPEVGGGTIAEIRKTGDFRGNTNPEALVFAQKGDDIVSREEFTQFAGSDGMIETEDIRNEFEAYQARKEEIKKAEKQIKAQKDLFKTIDTFKLAGQDKTLIGEITQTREMPTAIMEIMDQVRTEKKARREEVLNHKARPLMKYIDRKTQRLPKLGSKTAFGKEGEQILKDLGFEDVLEANQALSDYISKRNEFVNPVSRLAMQERAAKFLQDKQKILEEVEKKIRAEARDRKSKIESIRDFFYMTEGEVREAIGDVDYRLLSENQFNDLLAKLKEKSIELALHSVAVAEVEWTMAEKELHRVENMQELLGYSKNLQDMTTEQLDNLNNVLGKYERGDVFLGVREMETLAKNANLPDVKTQRQILEEVVGKRTGLPIEKLREIVVGAFDDLRSAVSLSRQNAFYEILVNDFYQLKIEAGIRYREVEQKTNELVKKARNSRPQSLKQRLAPTDDLVIAYLEEGDVETRSKIAKMMTNAELELAMYVKAKYAEMRDFLLSREQLEKERQNYYTHRPRGFFEAWLRDGVVKTPTQFIRAFGRAFKETVIDANKMDEATFKILNEQTSEILPLEKFFKYSMRRSGQLIPTKNLANAFLGYTKTFETKKGLDQYMPRMEAVARALTPSETTEGGVVKDTSLERFVKRWINTQKGRPITVGPIQPGGVLDGLLRGGVAFTRFLDLALRFPAQFMSLVGEESATWINIGTKKYLTGQYRAKTAQGNKIIKKYESFVGTKFWDRMREESSGIGSKIGETMFAFYGIAARNANIHHLLGVLTEQEFKSGEVSTERLAEIKKEMTRWRADDLLASVMGKTSVGSVFREHKSWAIPIVNQTLSDIKTLSKMVSNGEYKQASKSREFGELFRATMLTLILVLTISKMYDDLKEKKDRTFTEELQYRAMNDAFSFLAALSPKTLFTQPRLMSWLGDLSIAVTSFAGALATGERTSTGKIPGAKGLGASVTPKLIKPLFKETEEDKVQTSVDTATIKAQAELDAIKPEIKEPAEKAWSEVKKLGVGTEEADAVVSELSDDEYEAYKLVKKADNEYWTQVSEKVTPIVHEAFKLEFGTEEANKLVEPLSDDEYEMYKKVKSFLYGKGEATAQPSDWDKQSFLTHVKNMAKGWTTDPVDAFNKLIKGGDWKITDVKNGQIIVDRMPMDASQKLKAEVAKNNKNYKMDHIWAVQAGGGSDKNNLNIITTEEWEANTPVEVYLIKQLDAGNISGEEAKEYMVRFKIGRGQVTSGPLFEKYKTPITFEEIKQEIAK